MPVLLFCEGKPNSLDALILNRLLEDVPAGSVLRPTGGKNGLPSFIEGSLASYPGSPSGYLALRDRDFDAEPSTDVALIPLPKTKKPIFLTHRACIENYLISAEMIHAYLSLPSQVKRRQEGVPVLGDVERLVREAARNIAGYQAVRWALSSFLNPSLFPTVKDKLTSQSGELPESLTFEDCVVLGVQHLEAFTTAVSRFEMQEFRDRADRYFGRFSSEAFYENHEYLVWFHGKDLCTSLRSKLHLGEMRVYLEWAAEHVDLTAFLDFLEWQAKVTAMI